jgi:hypothetical protein
VVSRDLTRLRLTVAALAVAEVLVVAGVASAYGTDGVAATLAALVLAPVAVTAVFRIGRRVAGESFALAATAVYVALPALGSAFMLSAYLSTFSHEALPDLLGTRGTPYFAGGVLVAVVMSLRPSLAAALGIVLLAGAVVADGGDGFGAIRDGLHETAWSISMLVWIGAAGIVGATRRAPLLGVGLGAWIIAGVVHGVDRGYDHAAFWQALAATTPAAAVLVSALALLVPRLRGVPAGAL